MVAARPPKWCAVSLSEVRSRGLRLEASVYDVEARAARERVISRKRGWRPLGGKDGLVSCAFYPGRFKRVYCSAGEGEPFFLPSQLSAVCPEPDKWISAITDCPMEIMRLKEGTIILARSGSIGPVAIVTRTLAGKLFSDDVIRVSFKNDCDVGYVYAYLKSEIGNKLLTQSQYGSVITHIEPEHLAALPVPNAPDVEKRRIHETVMKSYALRDESNDLLARARTMLAEALEMPERGLPASDDSTGAPPALPQTPLSFSVRLHDLAGRLDCSYHLPVVRSVVSHLREHAAEVATVGERRISKEIILPGRFKRVYVEEGFGKIFIGGKQLGELDPANKKYLSVSHHEKQIEGQLAIQEGMTLVTCSGTIGRVALVGRHWDGWTASQHILRVVPASPDISGYLYMWLSSVWAKPLIVRNSYGAVIDEISDAQLASVPVPILRDAAVQSEINALALRASSLRSDAYDLEQSALRMMDGLLRPL